MALAFRDPVYVLNNTVPAVERVGCIWPVILLYSCRVAGAGFRSRTDPFEK